MTAELSKYLYRRKISLREACMLAGIEFNDEVDTGKYTECHSCSVWHLESELKPDLDGVPICGLCESWYGK